MKQVYISGKISNLDMPFVNLKFARTETLISSWHAIFQPATPMRLVNPLSIKPLFGIKTWLCYMVTDIIALKKCNEVCFQPDWTASKGACIERAFALYWKKTIREEERLKFHLKNHLNNPLSAHMIMANEAIKKTHFGQATGYATNYLFNTQTINIK